MREHVCECPSTVALQKYVFALSSGKSQAMVSSEMKRNVDLPWKLKYLQEESKSAGFIPFSCYSFFLFSVVVFFLFCFFVCLFVFFLFVFLIAIFSE